MPIDVIGSNAVGATKVTPASWAQSFLQGIGAPATSQNIKIIVGWEAAEGGAGPQFGISTNTANYNPLNTTQPASNSTTVNSAGVQSFPSWQVGLTATIQTINNGNFGDILAMLSTGSASSAKAAQVIDSSKWGTKDLTASLIDGANTTGGTAVGATPGGVAGLGGTGTASNDVPLAPFQVGDSSNPNEDYWTAINRLAQARYWYVFSDGETLYLADGPDLMAQDPAVTIDRFQDADRIQHLDFTWDNTAFQYATTHRKRQRIQRRTTLAKVQSPVMATLELVCAIDEVRAGDVVLLSGCGPGDGKWLIGDCTRSIFQIYSTLTLVPALSPLTETQAAGVGTNTTTNVGLGSGSFKGLASPFSKKYTATSGNVDMGVDFGTQQGIAPGDPIRAIADCRCTSVQPNWYAGQPAMWFQFSNGPINGYWGWYVAEQIQPIVGAAGTVFPQGTTVAQFASNGTGIEIGFAAADKKTATQGLHPNETGGRHQNGTTDGFAFLDFLKAVGAV